MTDPALFGGPWVGETIGCNVPAHLWDITLFGLHLRIDTRWEGFSQRDTLFGTRIEDQPAFNLDYYAKLAVLVDPQHFVIVGWDTTHSATPDSAYDVVFSRPGVAELSAHEAYRHFRANYAYHEAHHV